MVYDRRSVVDHRAQLAHIQQRFIEHRDRGSLPEGTVDKLMISPLLDLAGLYDSRFTIRTEASVEIDPEEQGCCEFEPESETNYGDIATIVITNHGPRGIVDATPYNHYSLLRRQKCLWDFRISQSCGGHG
jgi:hypothetical protein